MNSEIKYRVKFSYALKMSLGFVVMTTLTIFAGLSVQELDPRVLLIPFAMYLFYVSKVLEDDSGSKFLQLVPSTLAFVATALAILFLGGLALAVIGVGLFGILGAYYVWINFITRQPVIEATNEKLMLHNGFFKGRNFEVSWDEVENLSVRTQNLYGGHKMKWLVVKLVDAEQFKQRNTSKALAKAMAMNEKMYGGQLAVVASNLEVNEQNVLDQLNKYLKRP